MTLNHNIWAARVRAGQMLWVDFSNQAETPAEPLITLALIKIFTVYNDRSSQESGSRLWNIMQCCWGVNSLISAVKRNLVLAVVWCRKHHQRQWMKLPMVVIFLPQSLDCLPAFELFRPDCILLGIKFVVPLENPWERDTSWVAYTH